MKRVTLSDFLQLRGKTPVIDVRAPIEFAQGHIRKAVNIPLLTDSDRAAVGTIYKQKGQQEAILEGFRRVGPRLPEMVQATLELAPHREALIHCWRGGMRSDNFCKFVEMAGVHGLVLEGGYKAYTQEAQRMFRQDYSLLVLTGCTGSGKTEILRELSKQGEQVLDLEGLASHRGSAFGGLLLNPQPTTEQFQNDLFESLLKLDPRRRIWVEDESIAIGKIFIPSDFWKQIQRSSLVMMDVDRPVRVQRIADEYGPSDRTVFLEIMSKITRKLGGQNFNAARDHLLAGDFQAAVDILLTSYYDKAYLSSIERRHSQIRAKFSWDGKSKESFAKQLAQWNQTLAS